jgi:hypothetical protein
MAFEVVWKALQTHLEVGTTIPNWTVHRGMIGESFRIDAVDQNAIVVNAPGATKLQSVRRRDFEAVYELWDGYRYGSTPRSTFNELTRCSKYVISILHWLEEQLGGRLP